jgi:hypothetical protein
MGWPVSNMGAGAILYPGYNSKEHTRAAIQLASGDAEHLHIYEHTGWRETSSGLAYLHAGGAIGPDGPELGVHTDLGELAAYSLPDPPQGNALIEVARAPLDILNLAPRKSGWALLGTVFRAVLGTTDYTLWLAGPTGSFKSERAAIAQSFWGSTFTSRSLPANWESTANASRGTGLSNEERASDRRRLRPRWDAERCQPAPAKGPAPHSRTREQGGPRTDERGQHPASHPAPPG